MGKKDMVPALAGQYTVQFVFKIVLEVWAEISKLVKGGLTDHQQNTERNVRRNTFNPLICILSQKRVWAGSVGAVA